MNQIKKIAATLLATGMLFSVASCGNATEAVSSEEISSEVISSEETSSEVESSKPETTTAVIDTLSDDIYSFQVELEGTIYQLPTTVEAFTENGWVTPFTAEDTLKPNQKTLGDPITKDNTRATIILYNGGVDTLAYEKCNVTGINLSQEIGNIVTPTFSLPKGITMGSTYEEVIAAYGEPTNLYEGSSFKTLTYQRKLGDEVVLTVDSATNVVTGVKMSNLTLPATDTAGSTGSAATITASGNYTAPTALGTNFDSFNVSCEGVM